MKKTFEERIKENLPEAFQINDLCYDGEELGFSWHACKCCGSSLGGDRYKANLYSPTLDNDPIELSVCVDCICYIANGDLPEE